MPTSASLGYETAVRERPAQLSPESQARRDAAKATKQTDKETDK